MKRTVTPEERQVLLDNPGLVMFDPYSVMKTHRASVIKSLLLPTAVIIAFVVFGFIFPDFCNAHPNLFAGVGGTALILSSAFLPIHYWMLDDRAYNRARETYYSKYLKQLLPEDLECNVGTVEYCVYEKCEGGWIVDGNKESFGYSSCVNIFKFVPETDVAFVSNGKGFFAFVRRDPVTECFYK